MIPKIIVSTSNAYKHVLPVFFYLFNKNWSDTQNVEVVGYDVPTYDLPQNFSFVSLGKQSNKKTDFSNDLRKYFETQPDWFIWLFEDTFIRKVDFNALRKITYLMNLKNVGRINLSEETIKQDHFDSGHTIEGTTVFFNTQTAKNRLSTQPSIWNKKFLLQYLTKDLSPWDFETQNSYNDGWITCGFGIKDRPLIHNEGVRKRNIHEFNLLGISEDQLREMKLLGILSNKE